MIHAQGTLTLGNITYTGDTYLFLKSYLSGKGTTENEFIIYRDHAMTQQLGAYRLPDYAFEDFNGGNGNNLYEKVLDVLHDLTIEKLKVDNPQTVFTKVAPLQNVTEIN
jgi:hypothetical protein